MLLSDSGGGLVSQQWGYSDNGVLLSPVPARQSLCPLCRFLWICPSLSGFSRLKGRCSFPKVMPSELGPTTKLSKHQVLQLFQFTSTLPFDSVSPITAGAVSVWPIILGLSEWAS